MKQSIFDHHQFELICPAETIDGVTGIFTSSREMIGTWINYCCLGMADHKI
nr:hypothetical protein [uncultured Chitinophaga sp.]